ncbi:Uma2 family endonuclease [Nonomuraea sp. NPDC050547]|uniref:Uma2 family endonuclease n=1 Tax=unclassified Nonomuraea TaxID=2593643 RepID=UPI0037BDC729
MHVGPSHAAQLDTLDAYLALDEETRRDIEVVDGVAATREQRSRGHQKTGRRLAEALENGIEKHRRSLSRSEKAPCVDVNTEIEVILWDVPLRLRKPDVVVHTCLEPGEWLRAEDVIIAVEVLSPHSQARDRIHKAGEYAKAGIPHYLIVQFDDQGAVSIEHHILIGGGPYSKSKTTHRDVDALALSMTTPFVLDIDWLQLDIAPIA